MNKKLLVVGAGGFIGGFIAAEGLRRGFDTFVAVRESTSRRYLTDNRLHFVTLDYDNGESVMESLNDALPQGEKWDYIIYNLGATKCANFMDFNRINFLYLRNFVEALRKTDKVPHRFLFMSSLSALGMGDEKNYTPISSTTMPNPNTRYGLSKIKAETYLETLDNFPYIVFRPTGVYGPHEKDYLMMIKSIDNHWDFGVGYRKQLLTFIYVEDLVNAMFDAYDAGVVKKKYIISEDASYTQKQFREIVAQELGVKWVIPIKLPLWIVYVASYIAEKWAAIQLKASTLNRDKFKIMRQRNWSCDVSDAKTDFNFNPIYSLKEGIKVTVDAYQKEKDRK
ncbi:MAG: NAD(P)-dependent oxidoreductase [Bacteroidales bacterium]|nr:NAD(P)-dependent oxidoreductase [Bacteroidales bacterium]